MNSEPYKPRVNGNKQRPSKSNSKREQAWKDSFHKRQSPLVCDVLVIGGGIKLTCNMLQPLRALICFGRSIGSEVCSRLKRAFQLLLRSPLDSEFADSIQALAPNKAGKNRAYRC